MRIVVVEDEDNTREGLIRLIQKLNIECGQYEIVGGAENGLEGYQLVEEHRPDLIITDIKMPKMNGIEMLEKLKEQGHRHKTVVLTGFSEFEYAKRALQLGVVDYLEKPITAADLKNVLKKIEQELAYQHLVGLPNSLPVEQTEQLILRTLSREDVDPALLAFHLSQTAGFNPSLPFHLIQCYLGPAFKNNWDAIKKTMGDHFNHLGCTILFVFQADSSINLILQGQTGKETTLTLLQETIMALKSNLGMEHAVISFCANSNLSDLREGMRRLRNIRKWSISGINAVILSEDAINQCKVQAFPYPEQIENRMAAAIVESRSEEIQRVFLEWESYCFKRVFPPQQIINATVRFMTSILKQIAGLYGDDMAFGSQNDWLNLILKSQTQIELSEAISFISGQVRKIHKNSVYSLGVTKTLQMIHKRYHEGITLEEIAAVLGITPEYLSSLFNKEVKKNYSFYVKELRIKKAKELLLQSEMKVFEIAQSIGYPDAKYFSRVFKEMTGVSPGDFQRMNKRS